MAEYLKDINNQWREYYGKKIYCEFLVISNCGDIHPDKNGPIFPVTKIIVVNRCDKNFVYYWIREEIFPAAQIIYLLSHPCDLSVMRRFSHCTMYVLDDYERYITRSNAKLPHIILSTRKDIEKDINIQHQKLKIIFDQAHQAHLALFKSKYSDVTFLYLS